MEIVASQIAPQSDSAQIDTALSAAQAQGRYVRIRDWTSEILPTPRDLFIHLPEAYLQEPSRSFPLLLLHDGQNLFDGYLSYVKGSTWQVGSTADREIAAGMVEPLIVVGIANTGVDRMAEYTPTPDLRLGGGQGPLYARLLIEELLPWLQERYRIRSGPESTGIAGASLGGLISLAIGLRYPHVFGRIGVLSPSIWWDERSILKDVRSLSSNLPLRIWLDIGMAEGPSHVRDTNLLAKLLQDKGWQLGDDLLYRRIPGAGHNEDAWAARFGDVLRFLFPARS
jgi:predicted alpha/beta superfamily hydrolase